MKTLTAYFSLSGTTKKAAERVQALAGGDLFEIKGEKNYGSYGRNGVRYKGLIVQK